MKLTRYVGITLEVYITELVKFSSYEILTNFRLRLTAIYARSNRSKNLRLRNTIIFTSKLLKSYFTVVDLARCFRNFLNKLFHFHVVSRTLRYLIREVDDTTRIATNVASILQTSFYTQVLKFSRIVIVKYLRDEEENKCSR